MIGFLVDWILINLVFLVVYALYIEEQRRERIGYMVGFGIAVVLTALNGIEQGLALMTVLVLVLSFHYLVGQAEPRLSIRYDDGS